MELLADRDPEEARKLLDPVTELMMQAVHHYEGTVNQVRGESDVVPKCPNLARYMLQARAGLEEDKAGR